MINIRILFQVPHFLTTVVKTTTTTIISSDLSIFSFFWKIVDLNLTLAVFREHDSISLMWVIKNTC